MTTRGPAHARDSEARSHLTLARLFAVATIGITLLVGILFYVFVDSSRRSILRTSDMLRESAAMRIEARVQRELAEATRALGDIERDVHYGVTAVTEPSAVEPALFAELLNSPRLEEVTFTHAVKLGYDPEGRIRLAPLGRWQLSVFRASKDPRSGVHSRRVSLEAGRFVAYFRDRPPEAGLFDVPFRKNGEVRDPTDDLTFQTIASSSFYGTPIWSDLHWSELDAALPEEQRRVVVTVQKTIEDPDGRFAGVLRVGLLAQTVDEVSAWKVNENDPNDPHRIFLCDPQGRLVTRLDSRDRLTVMDDDLRVMPHDLPPAIAAALSSPLLGQITSLEPEKSGVVNVAGRPFLVTFRELSGTQDWIVGVVVPEDHYTHDLEAFRDRFLGAYLLVTAVVLAGGSLTLRSVRRALGRVAEAAARMRHFDFSPSPSRSSFRDVEDVMDGIERAKTAMRALGKYVPIDLVRQLYESNREPVLGGELVLVSLMFTDIKDFTSLSERLPPGELARTLGRYLQTMTMAIEENHGTIDKFIGDSVMVIWNAPTPCPDHAEQACRAALACIEATRKLYASPEWGDVPPLFTRFGLHRGTVMVGHFGAPDRLSYTALGDGVNLAARLEGLCKQYEVAVLASEAIEEAARGAFDFRLIDLVRVKGKAKAVKVYELLGPAGAGARTDAVRAYERAFAAYARRAFAEAIAILEDHLEDRPSKVLRDRCAHLLVDPPPPDWDGVYVALSK